MNSLTFNDKERMANLFGIKGGYVFSYLRNGYNKTTTRNLILDSTGIDIYSNQDYDLSQEKCIRKIWEECNDHIVGSLLKSMLDYFDQVVDCDLDRSEQINYNYLRELQEKLISNSIDIPRADSDDMKLVREDIEKNVANNTPELAVDRLHTFCTEYIRGVCLKHNIEIENNKNEFYSLESLIAKLKKWYKENDYFESEFCYVSIQNTINIFAKFNEIRNKQSAAHPNVLLNKAEAEYSLKIVSSTLGFIENIEAIKDDESEEYDFDDLPF